MTTSKNFSFTESEVRDWCHDAEDYNPLHLNAAAAEDHPLFGERIVPGVMLLDRVSGLISQWAEANDGTAVLSNFPTIDFENPVTFEEEVNISVEEEEADDDAHILFFEAVGTDDGETKMRGFATVYLF